VSQVGADGGGDPLGIRVGCNRVRLERNGEPVGDSHLSLLLVAAAPALRIVPFDEALQRLHRLVEQLEMPQVQRTLPGMLVDTHALAALRSLYNDFLELSMEGPPGRSGPF
jgi:hypothetical protein